MSVWRTLFWGFQSIQASPSPSSIFYLILLLLFLLPIFLAFWETNKVKKKEGNVWFNDALNTFYLRLYGVRHMVEDHSDSDRGNHMGYSFRLTARVLLYAQSHRQDSTYHGLRGALAGMRNSSMGSPHEGSIWRPIAPWANVLTTELHLAPQVKKNTI